jgi:hypothetical protein
MKQAAAPRTKIPIRAPSRIYSVSNVQLATALSNTTKPSEFPQMLQHIVACNRQPIAAGEAFAQKAGSPSRIQPVAGNAIFGKITNITATPSQHPTAVSIENKVKVFSFHF